MPKKHEISKYSKFQLKCIYNYIFHNIQVKKLNIYTFLIAKRLRNFLTFFKMAVIYNVQSSQNTFYIESRALAMGESATRNMLE